MQVQSLGYRTDLIFPQFDGQIIDRGSYLVILTPNNPTFHWGNFLLFEQPPQPGDLENWKDLFAREISARFKTEHLAFGWDTIAGETGEIKPFLDAGFDMSQSVVLAARQLNLPPKYNHEVAIRPLTETWEWEQALRNQITYRDPQYPLESYQPFKENQMQRYRQMSEAGLGHWFGAFLGKELVADLGLFASGKLGRFQHVSTVPAYQRRGICGALVYQAGSYALQHMQLETLVMVADENYHAAQIYESVGFKPKEHQVGLDWWE
jgi:GNAT superfamily N-acetyltransferase